MKPIRVLLVDDNVQFLRTASRLLAEDPHFMIVGAVQSGRAALEEVDGEPLDLVLMDLAMPEMNGLDVTRQIKRRTGAPCVVILTLHDNAEYRSAAQLAGADGFVGKSELATELGPLIRALLDEHGTAAETYQEEPRSESLELQERQA
jgi:DNA-binding NarL/FixJ family response regulator